MRRLAALGDFVELGDVVAHVDGAPVVAPLKGMIRGLKLTGVSVGADHKVGDIDPRRDRTLLKQMTDKAKAVFYHISSGAESDAERPTAQNAKRLIEIHTQKQKLHAERQAEKERKTERGTERKIEKERDSERTRNRE